MKASKPKNEVQRIKVLWQYDVLDTEPEAVFDELTTLAALICGAPIALITFVDEQRQWFKSKTGVSIGETSRDVSMCAHAILQDDLFIVSNATQDKRFKDNPLVVASPKIRFYAGVPLLAPGGYALGTLCVVDTVARELTDNQKKALRLLARHVMTQLELRRQSRELIHDREDTRKLKQELTQARLEIARLRRNATARKAVGPAVRKPSKRARN
jgi:GAF domain-containing protein